MDDVFDQARQKIGPALVHTFFNSPDSYTRNGDYFILSPLRGDKKVGSFKITEETGLYYDYATGEGGDFIDLVSKARAITLIQAAKDIIEESGGIYIEPDENKKSKRKQKKQAPAPKIPIEDTDEIKKSIKNRVQEKWCLDNWGEAENIYRYFNEDGEWIFCVCRFVKESKIKGKKRSKNDIPFYMTEDGKWFSKWHDDFKPFPPYGVQNLQDSNLPVLIVEGEKCACVDVPGYNVISWPGGTNRVDQTNWKALRNKEVIIWPDSDSQMDKNKEYYLPKEMQPGMKAAFYLKSIIPRAKILDVYRNKSIEDNPDGWDIADLVNIEKGDPLQFIEEFTPYNNISVTIDPYQVYRKFIDSFYEYDSLEQANSGYWFYSSNDHYWNKIKKNDIYCNFQRWLEDTNLQWIISKKQKATTFINDTKQYIDRHSLGYIYKNPFKEAAISPYIHLKNGAVKISKYKTEWFDREDYGEDFFKKLYPIHALDFGFNYKNYKNIDPEKDCPGFYFFCKEIIPREYMVEITSDEEAKKAIKETIIFISQIIAYSLSPVKPNEYFFGIYGNERTGKSFLLKIIKSIVGAEFCVEKKIADMDNRFASSGLWGKKIFIEPDLKTRKPLPEDFIKAHAGEQEITVEEKNMPAIDGVKTSLALFFISNYEFHTKGLEGIARRMIMIPYKNDIAKHDPLLLDKILGDAPHGSESDSCSGDTFDERPGIMALALQGWDRFCKNDYILKSPEWVQLEKDSWIIESNSVLKFMEEIYFIYDSETTKRRTDMYDDYKDWCKDEGRKALGKKNFYEEVRRDRRTSENKLQGYESFTLTPENKEIKEIPF